MLKVYELHKLIESRTYEKVISILIVLYVLTLIVFSYPSLQGTHVNQIIIVTFGIIFTLEYLLKIFVSLVTKESLKWMTSFLGIIDLVAVLSFLLSLYFPYNFMFLRVLRVLKVLPVNQENPVSKSLSRLIEVIHTKKYDLMASFFLLTVFLVIASCAVFCFENEIQPDKFKSIPHSMWWAIITMTTVGYGDIYPVTPLGKLVGGLFSVIGFGFVALPAAIISTGYINFKGQNSD